MSVTPVIDQPETSGFQHCMQYVVDCLPDVKYVN